MTEHVEQRPHYHVHAPGQPSEVDGVMYDSWDEARRVLEKAWSELHVEHLKDGGEWSIAVSEVMMTTAEYLADTVEVDV